MTTVDVLDEQRALDCFWSAVASKADKLHMLCELARVRVVRRDDWDRVQVRETSEQTRRMLMGLECFCCGGRPRQLTWHHVIQVQHGGSGTARNLVALCAGCHSQIHPWLVPQPVRGRGDGWYSTGDLVRLMAGRVRRLLQQRA